LIVVDTNVIAHLMLPGGRTEEAEWLYESDPQWAAPLLWRSEFRNLLATRQRHNLIPHERALALSEAAEALLGDRAFPVPSRIVLELARDSGCTAYDCEFVALALELEVHLVTADGQLLRAFPGIAVPFN
jgi:predicted nucleic acid-binding protein